MRCRKRRKLCRYELKGKSRKASNIATYMMKFSYNYYNMNGGRMRSEQMFNIVINVNNEYISK
jgi:hypothetical protein